MSRVSPGRPPDPGNCKRTYGGVAYRSGEQGSITDVSPHTYVTSREQGEQSDREIAWVHDRDDTVISSDRAARRRHESALTRTGEPEARRWRPPW